MSIFLEDLKFSLRVLLKRPAFSAIALLTLALAIGANTAIFSVVNGVLLEPLPYPHADRLIEILRKFPSGEAASVSVPDFVYFDEHAQSFDGMSVYDNLGSGFNLVGDGTPERVVGSRVSASFFGVMAVKPALGRAFLPEEERLGAAKVLVLSNG